MGEEQTVLSYFLLELVKHLQMLEQSEALTQDKVFQNMVILLCKIITQETGYYEIFNEIFLEQFDMRDRRDLSLNLDLQGKIKELTLEEIEFYHPILSILVRSIHGLYQ